MSLGNECTDAHPSCQMRVEDTLGLWQAVLRQLGTRPSPSLDPQTCGLAVFMHTCTHDVLAIPSQLLILRQRTDSTVHLVAIDDRCGLVAKKAYEGGRGLP